MLRGQGVGVWFGFPSETGGELGRQVGCPKMLKRKQSVRSLSSVAFSPRKYQGGTSGLPLEGAVAVFASGHPRFISLDRRSKDLVWDHDRETASRGADSLPC
jgi:hypothetical protein